ARGSIYYWVFREELRLALLTNCQGETWGAQMLHLLRIMGCDLVGHSAITDIEEKVNALAAYRVDTAKLVEGLQSKMRAGWRSDRIAIDPRDFVSDGLHPGIKMCRYHHWMGDSKHMAGYIPHTHHISLIRFRLCCWVIEVNRPNGRVRALRYCPMCESGVVDDEYHVLMECPAYESIRLELLQAGDVLRGNMIAIMSLDNQRILAEALYEIRCMRRSWAGELII
ncbi:hypothetical protein Vretimale_15312, partial [Volvox reticuliferus]